MIAPRCNYARNGAFLFLSISCPRERLAGPFASVPKRHLECAFCDVRDRLPLSVGFSSVSAPVREIKKMKSLIRRKIYFKEIGKKVKIIKTIKVKKIIKTIKSKEDYLKVKIIKIKIVIV